MQTDSARAATRIDKLLAVIKAWIETESGPTLMKFHDPELQVQVSIRGYKKITLERTFGKR